MMIRWRWIDIACLHVYNKLSDYLPVDLRKENKELRAENEKEKQKRTRSSRQIDHEGDLWVQEVREIRSELFKAQVARINAYREQVSEGL